MKEVGRTRNRDVGNGIYVGGGVYGGENTTRPVFLGWSITFGLSMPVLV